MIERGFRFCKTDLGIGFEYVRLFNRIETRVCICFVAYTIILRLVRILKTAGSGISLDCTRFLTEKTYPIDYVNPYDGKHKSVLLHTKEQPEVTELLNPIARNCRFGCPIAENRKTPHPIIQAGPACRSRDLMQRPDGRHSFQHGADKTLIGVRKNLPEVFRQPCPGPGRSADGTARPPGRRGAPGW